MLKKILLSAVLLLQAPTRGMTEGTAGLADYYQSLQQYDRALPLWEELEKKQPDVLSYAFRVADLKFVLEGPSAATTHLWERYERLVSPPYREDRKALRAKFNELGRRFLTNQGQTYFLQAQFKVGKNDRLAALSLFENANGLEQNNTMILRAKAACELTLGFIDAFYSTLQKTLVRDPLNLDAEISLVEAHLFSGYPKKAFELFVTDPDLAKEPKARLAYGVTLAQLGRGPEAIGVLKAADSSSAQGEAAVAYELGRLACGGKEGICPEGKPYFKKLLKYQAPVAGWDPYRLAEKVETVKKQFALP